MSTISIQYTTKYQLSFATHYQFSDKLCFNMKTGRQIKQVYNNGCIGYSICGKFYSLKILKGKLQKIPTDEDTPF